MLDARLNPLVPKIVLAALSRAGVQPPRSIVPDDLRAPIGREQQHALLLFADETLVPEGVLGIGRALIRTLEDTPDALLLLLLNQSDVDAFLAEVARLNRYFHSRHRHEVLERAPGKLRLRHISSTPESPRTVESRFVAGLYLGFLEEIGCDGVELSFADTDPSDWTFTWRRFASRRARLPGLEVVLDNVLPEDLERTVTARGQVAAVIARELSRRWTVAEVARSLAVSTRSLQRKLRAEETCFSKIVEECRLEEASRLLAQPAPSITEIGFLCGFSDTAHFSRRFKRRNRLTPTEWRSQNARG